MLDEAIVVIGLSACARHPARPIVRATRRSLARRSLLGDRVAGVDPVCVDVDGLREIVDVRLEGLAADFTLEVADAGLLLD